MSGFSQPYYNQQSNFLNANKVWAFYENEGLDFNTGVPPVPINTHLGGGVGQEGVASVADPESGVLLFYTNGANVWDKDDQVMPNGSALLGNSGFSMSSRRPRTSTSQGVCIVPMIDDPDRYYVFSLISGSLLEAYGSNQDSFAAFYSIVDMTLRNGLGDVDTNNKNIPLTPNKMPYSEAMIAVPGNCNDIWIILHRSDSAVYDAYHVTKDGISPIPVTSRTSGPNSVLVNNYAMMAISPNRTKLAFCSGNWLFSFPFGGYGSIAEFDAGTGIISNPIILGGISNSTDSAYRFIGRGAAFSPNGKYFYSLELSASGIVQYDVSVHDYDSINQSRQVISSNVVPQATGCLRLYGDTIYYAGTGYINLIADPNTAGIACNYIDTAIKLSGATSAMLSLPSEVVYPISKDTIYSLQLDTIICYGIQGGMLLTPSELNAQFEYQWSDLSSASTLNVTDTGVYWVAYHNSCDDYIVDTFKIKDAGFIKPQITINVDVLAVQSSYTTYQWMLYDTLIPGATQPTYNVTGNGDYRVIVTSAYGCIDTSAVYRINNLDETTIPAFDLNGQIRIYPNPATDFINISAPFDINVHVLGIDGRNLKISEREKSIPISNLSPGIYLLRICDVSGRFIKVEKIIKVSQ